MSGFDFEYHCVNLFFWFDKSTKRKNSERILWVLWLWIWRCHLVRFYLLVVFREVHQQYTGLKSYFLSEGLNNKRFCRLSELFNDPVTKVYLLFLQSVIPLFMYFNRFLQKEEPLVYIPPSWRASKIHE